MKTMKNKPIWLYVFGLILLFFIGSVFMLNTSNSENKNVHITLDGKEINEIDNEKIDLNIDRTFTIETENGYNIVEIKNKTVRVASANCPDKICVKKGKIDKGSFADMIICAPHKMVVSIY